MALQGPVLAACTAKPLELSNTVDRYPESIRTRMAVPRDPPGPRPSGCEAHPHASSPRPPVQRARASEGVCGRDRRTGPRKVVHPGQLRRSARRAPREGLRGSAIIRMSGSTARRSTNICEQRLPVERYDQFADMKAESLALGSRHVKSAPLVRSSYQARDQAPDAEAPRAARRQPTVDTDGRVVPIESRRPRR
jgi:hypothetical protein